MWQDLKYALRTLARQPGLAAAAVLSLSLGIGANATVFSWVKGVLLRPLPGVDRPDEIRVIAATAKDGAERSFSYPNYRDIRDRAKALGRVIAQDDFVMTIAGTGEAERVFGMIVSANYFDVLEVRAALGRTFTAADDEGPGASPYVVLSDNIWDRRFGRDPGIVGRRVLVNNTPFTVLGVMPPEFTGTLLGVRADAWVPMAMQAQVQPGGSRLEIRGSSWMQLLTRLPAGGGVAQADAELASINAQLEKEFPQNNEGVRFALLPIWKAPFGAPQVLAPVLAMLTAVVALVLLIACANVANLLLGRALGRRRELAIRVSLGAPRGRLVRQLLTESVLLAVLGGLGGVVVAYWSSGLLMAMLPPIQVPIELGLGIDVRVLAYTAAVSLLTGVLFGLAPALQGSRADVNHVLKDDGARGGSSRGGVRRLLVVAQLALCLLLLVGAVLFLQSLHRAQQMSPGFDPDGVLIASVDLFPAGYTPDTGRVFYTQLLDRVNALPGVERAALARTIPLGFSGKSSTSIQVDGYVPGPTETMNLTFNNVSEGYFDTLRIPIVDGRSFDAGDRAGAMRVLVLNETAARRYWKGESPVGRTLRIGPDTYTVIGVAKDGKYESLGAPPRPYMYFSLPQSYRPTAILHVRASGDPAKVFAAVRSEIRALNPNLPLHDTMLMRDYLGQAVFVQRLAAYLLGVFGALALTLAVVGLYGVMAYLATQRTHEFGVRLALGASPANLRGMVIRQGLGLAGLGVVIGVLLALPLTRLAQSLLPGISPTDPGTFVGVSVVLTLVGVAAAAVPAIRASRVDPVIALRWE